MTSNKYDIPDEWKGKIVISKWEQHGFSVKDRHTARFNRLHQASKRPHPIPFCGEHFNSDDDDNWDAKDPEEEVDAVGGSDDREDGERLVDMNCTIRPRVPENWKDLQKEDGIKRDVVGDWTRADFAPIKMVNVNVATTMKHPSHVLIVNAMYSVRLQNVVSPTDFFLEFILEPPNDGCATWEESLQQFYNDPERAKKYQMRTIRPFFQQQYAFYNEDTKKWERLLVHVICLQTQCVTAFHLERVEMVRVPFKSLFELHPDYANWHRCPIKGALLDVFPVNPAEPNPSQWSEEACEFFCNFVKDKTYWALVAEKSPPVAAVEGMMPRRLEDQFMGATVVLFERGKKPTPPVNAWLIQKGYAYGKTLMSTSLEQMRDFYNLNLSVEDPFKKTTVVEHE
ncbi:hypothetical protein Ocin01_17119 [Orchesella cincta]|uniref:Uncharacterized protein n=1 Tax=Orchesella cincta TaxID=48709 RepID=A0A1D2M9B6_ORCCI|nr:hypothetical protein Ocin01_17119 [Orchesella cincta]